MADENEFQERFARYLKVALAEREMTVEELADRVDSNPRTVRRWLRGEALPHMATYLKVFTVLGRPRVLNLASLVPG
jgi:transcriptional regulator with XRE-family HTH domain